MATKNIAVSGQVFPCPLSWIVEQAEKRIRSGYGLQNGFIEEDGVPVLGTALIRDLAGALTFVAGQPIQQLGATVIAATAPEANAQKCIKVNVNLGIEIKLFKITVFQDSQIWEAVKKQVQTSLIVPRNSSLDTFELKDKKGYLVNHFSALDEIQEYIFEMAEFLIPASASDWTPSYTSLLQLSFKNERVVDFLGGSKHSLSDIAKDFLGNLTTLGTNNHTLYNTMNDTIGEPDQFHEKQSEIRQNPELQDVIRKGLFLMEHYPNNEAIVDNFLVHLFTKMGFYSGMLYAVPQLHLHLKFGDCDIKTAKPDFVIMDVLTFLRMVVFEEKNVKESQDENAEAQLMAEVIAAHQINTERTQRPTKVRRTEMTDSAAATEDLQQVPQTIFAVRVGGYHFTFYEVEVTEAIITAMRTKTSAKSITNIKRCGGTRGLNFLDSKERECIITIFDCWRDKICREE